MNTNNIIILILVVVGVTIAGYLLVTNSKNIMTDEDHDNDEIVAEYEIYPTDVAEKIKNNKDFVLLDVRTPEEYAEGHLKGALLLPVQELSQQSLTSIGLGEDFKNKEIIVYCRSGARSKTAYDIMKSLGYTNVKSSAGGMIHWEEDNLPFVETGSYVGPKTTEPTNSLKIEDGPRIALNSKFHDFGLVPQFGGVIEKTFTIRNTGNKTLIIGDLSTSCSCTSAKVVSKSVEVGQETILTVIFDPDFHAEPLDVFKRTVFIPSNDPTNPEAEIVIQVDIDEGK